MGRNPREFHAPFVLRTGFGYSYPRTVLLFLFITALQILAFLLGGLLPEVIATIPVWVILHLVVILGVSTVRDLVEGYLDLLGISQGQFKKKAKVYSGFGDSGIQNSEYVADLFVDKRSYNKFRTEVWLKMFSKFGTTFLVAGILLSSVYIILLYSNPLTWSFRGAILFPWTYLGQSAYMAWILLSSVLSASAVALFAGYVRALNIISNSPRDLRIHRYIQFLRKKGSASPPFMSYQGFHTNTARIGNRVYGVTMRIVFILAVSASLGIYWDLSSAGTVSLAVWLCSIFEVICAMAIFLIPQVGIHRLLTDTKNAVIAGLGDHYGKMTARFVATIRKRRVSMRTQRYVQRSLRELRVQLKEVTDRGTWTVEVPKALRVLGTSLVPLVIALLQVIFLGFL